MCQKTLNIGATSSKPWVPVRHVLFSSLYHTGMQAQKDEVTYPTLNNLYVDKFLRKPGNDGSCCLSYALGETGVARTSLGKEQRCSLLPSAGSMRSSGKSARGTGFL